MNIFIKLMLISLHMIHTTNCDDASDLDKCMFKYNRELSACYKPLLALVDPKSTFSKWKPGNNITESTIEFARDLTLAEIMVQNVKTGAVCTALEKLQECIKYAGLDSFCSNANNGIILVPPNTMKKYCNDKHNYPQEYNDCWNMNPSITTHVERWLTYYKPQPVCSFQRSERLSSDIFILGVLASLPGNRPEISTDARARLHCKRVEMILCTEKRRHLAACPARPFINLDWLLDSLGASLNMTCQDDSYCKWLANKYCKLHPETYQVQELSNISDFSNLISRNDLQNLFMEVGMDLLQVRFAASKNDVKNLLLYQTGCFYKTIMSEFDFDQLNIPGYFGNYLQERVHLFHICWNIYASSYPDTSKLLQYLPIFVDGLVKIATHPATTKTTGTCTLKTLLLDDTHFMMAIEKKLYSSFVYVISLLALTESSYSTYRAIHSTEISYTEKKYLAQTVYLESQDFALNKIYVNDIDEYYYVYKELCGSELTEIHRTWVQQLAEPYRDYAQVMVDMFQYIAHSII